eukprot:TRINITY_DN3103_c0_g1_i1.p1 TRINITY_DN3103_c0_g1~~TRINITY_DN3103_c0_g1_i1.p1  ORF type:complete len:174 (+),score=8.59 TRINITY_DN3103_c0_g1_i1:402-923(+)
MLPPRRCSQMPPHWPQQRACSEVIARSISVVIGRSLFVLVGNGVTKYEMTGNFDWVQVSRVDLVTEGSAEEDFELMKLHGERLFVASWRGRRTLVVLDQLLNELARTPWTNASESPLPLGERLLAAHSFHHGVRLFWLHAPDGHEVSTGVHLPDTFMRNLVYVSQDELASTEI